MATSKKKGASGGPGKGRKAAASKVTGKKKSPATKRPARKPAAKKASSSGATAKKASRRAVGAPAQERRSGKTRRRAARGTPRRATDISPDRLRTIPAFAGLSDEDAAHLLSVSTVRDLAPGVPVFREGEPGDGLYVILEGQVRIVKKNARGGEREVAMLEADEVFGEMDLIVDRHHTSTAKPDGIVRAFFLPREAFRALLDEGNRGATAMVIYFARMLAARLDENNQRMMQVLERPRTPASSEFAEFKRRLLREWTF